MRNLAVGILASASFTLAHATVGTASLEVQSQATSRKFVAEIWFTAAPGASAESFSPRPPIRPIAIARNAAPAAGSERRPLIVVSHGNWGSRFSQGWLALKLVEAGYIVVSTSHPGTEGESLTAAGRYRLWDRSRDVTLALDEMLNHPQWSRMVDPARIGFVGHSFGGWTGVSLAGGRYDPTQQRAYCKKQPTKDFYCDGTLNDDVSAIPAKDAADSFRDPRIKAFYIMGSGPGQGFSEESLKAIHAPFVIDTARFDEILEPAANSTRLARLIPRAKEILRPVGHFAYVPECRSVVGPLLARAIGIPLCNDPDGVDRAKVHAQVAQDVIQFFTATLQP